MFVALEALVTLKIAHTHSQNNTSDCFVVVKRKGQSKRPMRFRLYLLWVDFYWEQVNFSVPKRKQSASVHCSLYFSVLLALSCSWQVVAECPRCKCIQCPFFFFPIAPPPVFLASFAHSLSLLVNVLTPPGFGPAESSLIGPRDIQAFLKSSGKLLTWFWIKMFYPL